MIGSDERPTAASERATLRLRVARPLQSSERAGAAATAKPLALMTGFGSSSNARCEGRRRCFERLPGRSGLLQLGESTNTVGRPALHRLMPSGASDCQRAHWSIVN